jgi:serine phosphatase RsbU (regulator of sigma subunit)
MPLGIMPQTEFFAGEAVQLADDDIVLFYTDGLIEAQPESGHPFGTERVLEIVRENRSLDASELIETLYAAVRRHMGDEPLHDDVTVVVVKVEAR